jgi:hypothetical protein
MNPGYLAGVGRLTPARCAALAIDVMVPSNPTTSRMWLVRLLRRRTAPCRKVGVARREVPFSGRQFTAGSHSLGAPLRSSVVTDNEPAATVTEAERTHTVCRMSARSQRIEVITRGERRRRWAIKLKREIAAESLAYRPSGWLAAAPSAAGSSTRGSDICWKDPLGPPPSWW